MVDKKVQVRWNGQADGPYIHIDDVIDYLRSISTQVDTAFKNAGLNEEGEAVTEIFTGLITNYENLKAHATRVRLEAVVRHVDVDSLTNDLLTLRDELAPKDE